MQELSDRKDTNIFKRTIQGLSSKIELNEGVISIYMKSYEKSMVLFAHYSQDNMPSKLANVINSPQELFEVLKSLDQKQLEMTQRNQLIMHIQMFALKREYPLPLERAEMSKQDKLQYQNKLQQEEINQLNNKLFIAQERHKKQISSFWTKLNRIQQQLAEAKKFNIYWQVKNNNINQVLQQSQAQIQRCQQLFKQRQTTLRYQNTLLQKQISQVQQNIQRSNKQKNQRLILAHQNKRFTRFVKLQGTWDSNASYNNFFTISQKQVVRNSNQRNNYVQVHTQQNIPNNINIRIFLRVLEYGPQGGIIIGLTTIARKNAKFSGGTAKGYHQESIAYHTYLSKGQQKGRIYEYGSFSSVVPYLHQEQRLIIQIDRLGKQVFWSNGKEVLIHISPLGDLADKQLILFASMYGRGDAIEIY